MTPKVGVLSAVIAVGIGALAFKSLDIAQAFAEVADEVAAAPAEESPLTAADMAAQRVIAAGLSALDAAAEEAGLSANEIIVLRSLQARREALDERETGVETREAAAVAAETRLQEQISELKAVETQIQGLLAQMDTKRDERMASLVKSYESMKPKDAARIFDSMEDAVLLDLAKSMKPATLAAVMSSMQTKRAEALTRMLADLSKAPPAGTLTAKPPT